MNNEEKILEILTQIQEEQKQMREEQKQIQETQKQMQEDISELRTTVTMGAEVGGVTLLSAETRVEGEVVADTQMKIFVEP